MILLSYKYVFDINQVKVRFQAFGGSERYNVGYLALFGIKPYFSIKLSGVVEKYLSAGEVAATKQHAVA